MSGARWSGVGDPAGRGSESAPVVPAAASRESISASYASASKTGNSSVASRSTGGRAVVCCGFMLFFFGVPREPACGGAHGRSGATAIPFPRPFKRNLGRNALAHGSGPKPLYFQCLITVSDFACNGAIPVSVVARAPGGNGCIGARVGLRQNPLQRRRLTTAGCCNRPPDHVSPDR